MILSSFLKLSGIAGEFLADLKSFKFYLSRYRINEEVLSEAGEEYNWVNSLEMVKKMIQVSISRLASSCAIFNFR